MKNSVDYKSRFRILKGGKISLVVSALLVGSIISVSEAVEISTAVTTTQSHDTTTTDIDITSTGSITIIDDTEFAVTASPSKIGASHFISNAGTIEIQRANYVTAIGLYAYNKGTITNSGTITATSTSDEATGIFTYQNNSTLENTGIITVDAYTYAYGLKSIYNDYGSITNTGTISVTSEKNKAIGIDNLYNQSYSTITNAGTISITSEEDYATGINNQGNVMYSTIENTGNITVSAQMGATGIRSGNNYESSIINSGTINVSGDVARGIEVVDLEYFSSITNDGTISTTGTTHAMGITVVNLDYYSSITNNGTIRSTINGEASHDAFSIGVQNGDFTSNVLNDTNGKLYGNIYIQNAYFTNNGLISLPYNATGSDNAFINDFIQTQTGTLQIGLFTDGSTTTHSQLSTNDATFEDGSTIDVNVLSSSTNSELLIGQTLDDIVTASNSLTLEGTLNITDNSALLNFEYVEDGETIDLNVVEGTTILNSVASGGGNSITKAAASALETIQNTGTNTAMAPVFTALNKLPTNQAVAKAVESTTPQTTNATVGAAGQISNTITGIVGQAQNGNVGGGFNSGDEIFTQKNAWVKPFGSIGKQNNKEGLNGFDLDVYGIGMGIDGEYKPNQTLGVAFFYTAANVDINNIAQKSDLDVFTTLVYGNMPVIDNKTKLLYQLGYAWQKTNGKRTLFTGDTATSDYTSKTASLDLKLLRDYKINDDLLLQPMISTTYRHFSNPSYSETGAGALNLDVQKFTSTELILGAGTLVHYKLNDDSKIVGNINVGYDLHDKQQSVTASYQGASGVSFDTAGIDNGRWSYDLGVGYEMDINDFSNINFSYNRQGQGSDFVNNTISAKYVLKF
jgi:outer membrane autotransporter protein